MGLFGNVTGTLKNFKINCANITVNGYGEKIGIVCGQSGNKMSGITVTNGYVNAPNSDSIGGIVGYISFIDSLAYNDISCNSNIIGKNYVGGLFGQFYSYFDKYGSFTLTLGSLNNQGNVTGSGDYVGGIFGRLYYNNTYSSSSNAYVNAADLNNTGKITGKTYVGGLFGSFWTDGVSSGVLLISTGTVIGSDHFGDLFGEVTNLTISE